MLEGHCDWRGTAEYNLALGDHRAAGSQEVPSDPRGGPDKLDTVSKGGEEAQRTGDEAHDRRVEFVILKQP